MYQNIRTIKVGTFNLMNFMLPERSAYGGSLYFTKDEYRRKAEWIERMLNEIDADIIAFQELFHREALVRIIKNNPKYRHARVYMAEETGDQPSVALLSRYPVENIEVYTHFPENAVIDFNPHGGSNRVTLPFTTFTRPVIKADILIPDYGIITVFVIHLKSKREIFYAGEDSQNPIDLARAQSRSLMLRASESVAVRALVSETLEIPDRPVILCGDVNDTGNAVTSRIISGEVPQHRLSDSVKRRQWDLLLYHVKDIQARRSYQDFYYTHIHNGMYESLDHIMVSQELVTEYPRNTGRVGLVSVYNDHLIDQTFTQYGTDKCKSDHGVVVCSLELDLDRAAKYMKDTEGYIKATANPQERDPLDQIDEAYQSNRPQPKPVDENDESLDNDDTEEAQIRDDSAEDNVYVGDIHLENAQNMSDEADDDGGVITEKFNLQNALDRWKRLNPDSGRRDNNKRGRRNDKNRDQNEPRQNERRRYDKKRDQNEPRRDVKTRDQNEPRQNERRRYDKKRDQNERRRDDQRRDDELVATSHVDAQAPVEAPKNVTEPTPIVEREPLVQNPDGTWPRNRRTRRPHITGAYGTPDDID